MIIALNADKEEFKNEFLTIIQKDYIAKAAYINGIKYIECLSADYMLKYNMAFLESGHIHDYTDESLLNERSDIFNNTRKIAMSTIKLSMQKLFGYNIWKKLLMNHAKFIDSKDALIIITDYNTNWYPPVDELHVIKITKRYKTKSENYTHTINKDSKFSSNIEYIINKIINQNDK